MKREICVILVLLVILVNLGFVNAQFFGGDDSTDTSTAVDDEISDSEDSDITEGDESIDAGFGWDGDDTSSSQQQTGSQTTTPTSSQQPTYRSSSGGFTRNFYIALILIVVVVILVVIWIILLRKPIK